MSRVYFRVLSWIAVGWVLAAGQAANAVPFFYSEILTNNFFLPFTDVRASKTVGFDFDPMTENWSGSISGDGLGSGYVSEGNPLSYDHIFDPTPNSGSILQAWLSIQVVDDELDITPEFATVELNGSFWQTGAATLNLFFGDITALGLIQKDGDHLHIEVSSVPVLGNGDFRVKASALKVKFEPVPEPGTASLLGLGLVAFAVRRRARR